MIEKKRPKVNECIFLHFCLHYADFGAEEARFRLPDRFARTEMFLLRYN